MLAIKANSALRHYSQQVLWSLSPFSQEEGSQLVSFNGCRRASLSSVNELGLKGQGIWASETLHHLPFFFSKGTKRGREQLD